MFRIDEISKQHKELFPLTDESGQINKLQEELTEYMVAFGEWIESYTDLSEAVYKVFGSDDERLVNKIKTIFNKGVISFLEKASKPWWEVA